MNVNFKEGNFYWLGDKRDETQTKWSPLYSFEDGKAKSLEVPDYKIFTNENTKGLIIFRAVMPHQNDEELLMREFRCMCQESLDPETYEKSEEVEEVLRNTRRGLSK